MGTEPAFRRVPDHPRLVRSCGFVLGALALTAAAVFFGVRQPEDAGAAECPAQFTLDFNGLPAGTILGEQYANFGVHISGTANEGFPNALIVFDTNAPPTHDPDLAVDIGNIAIFAKNLTDNQPPPSGDGLVDDPDENNFGGRAVLAFDQDVSIGSVLWVDKDHAPSNVVVAYNSAGEVITSVTVPRGANASVQRIEINADGVARLEFVYRESGGFTGIEVACAQATPAPAGTSTGQPPAPAGTSTGQPPAPASSPAPAVAAASATPAPAVLAAVALPSGGGSPGDGGGFSWIAALLAPTLVAGAGIALVLKAKR